MSYIIVGNGEIEAGVGPSQADGFLVIGTRRILLAVKVPDVHRFATCTTSRTSFSQMLHKALLQSLFRTIPQRSLQMFHYACSRCSTALRPKFSTNLGPKPSMRPVSNGPQHWLKELHKHAARQPGPGLPAWPFQARLSPGNTIRHVLVVARTDENSFLLLPPPQSACGVAACTPRCRAH